MPAITLHYIFDPYCGWCYAAAPLIAAAASLPGTTIVLHGGGMLAGERRVQVNAALRDFVMPHDARITQMTGQVFGAAYQEGLLRDHTAILDSSFPITAILLAEALQQKGLAMLQRLQQAHYVEGQRIVETGVLETLAAELGLPKAEFSEQFASTLEQKTPGHIQASQQLLRRVGGQGFPTLLRQGASGLAMIDIGSWLGKPEAFKTWLSHQTV